MKRNSNILLLLALLALGLQVNAQTTTGTQPSSAKSPKSASRQIPKIGKIYGRLIDNTSGKAVGSAPIALLQAQNGKKVMVQAGSSDANGDFSFESLSLTGQFELVVTAPGLKELRQHVSFDMAALMKAFAPPKGAPGMETGGLASSLDLINKDLGNIRLEQNTQSLKEVTIAAKVQGYRLEGEKKIFNVAQNLVSEGGTAADVLKNVPGVLVDADNNVTIRNSAPQILIDGRPVPLQLTQIPADAIASIEIITNPSAKYDAEGGTGGILNIVLKKNRKAGYNGSVRAGVDSHGGGNLGGDFNARSGKINLSFTGQSSLSNNTATATTWQQDHASSPFVNTLQNETNTTKGAFGFGFLSLDYFVTNRTTISLGGMSLHAASRPGDNMNITTDSLLGAGTASTWATRNSNGKNTYDMNGGQFNLKHIFPKPGRVLTVDASLYAGKSGYGSDYNTTEYGTAAHTDAGTTSQQQVSGSGSNGFYMIQSDYSTPLSETGRLDVGVKTTVRSVESYMSNYNYDNANSQYVEIPNPNSDFKSSDAIFAGYGSYSGNFDPNNSFQLGLRAESSRYSGELTKTDSAFAIKYPVSLFPSVFYTRKMKDNQQLQFSYRRGINRPSFFQLLPYTDYTDPLNIRQGNPGLRPEFTNSVELNYMKAFKGSNYVLISAYERHTENLITAYQSVATNPLTGENGIITTYINATSSDKYGVEVTNGWDLTKWWNLNTDINVYNGQLNTAAGQGSSYLSGFGKLNNQFRFPGGWSAQLSGAYQSRTNLLPDTKNQGYGGMGNNRGVLSAQPTANAQGYMDALWYVDASIRKSFLKNDAATISLSVNDVFGTRKYDQHSGNELFTQDYSRLINPQMFRLNFSWRFGKRDMDLLRRKSMKGQMDGMQDASQNMGI